MDAQRQIEHWIAREHELIAERLRELVLIEGSALEGLVAQHLRAWIACSDRQAELFYWRTRSGIEVDFVVYGEAGFWALEVKNGARVLPEDLRGLQAFREDYSECQTMLLYRGEERLLVDRIRCLPAEGFLRDLRPDRQPDA